MAVRIRRRRWTVLVSVAGVVLFVAVGAYALWLHLVEPYVTSVSATTVTPVSQQRGESPGLPVRLKIPAIGVDASVAAMGVTSTGDMESPKGWEEAGWYKFGPHPGEIGSAVIAGHYGRWQNGEGSVFDKLHTLKPGDKLQVFDENGMAMNFTVRSSRLFGRDDDARSVFTSGDNKAHLNLITCQGEWNATAETFAERLVVFADRD